MLEKIKEVPFIDESRAVKLVSNADKLIMERNDRVIWASETITLPTENINCYVEADKFFLLLPDIQSLAQTTCLEITLKNGAKYELPFLSVEWESQTMPETYTDAITFKLDDLMLCTLKNLVKPELQCIYIDQEGSVSCDFVSACISKQVKATQPFLLPPDVQQLVNGRQCQLNTHDDKLYIKASDFSIVTPQPTLGEDKWWEDLRAMLPENATMGTTVTTLIDSMKRLQLFGDYVTFKDNKVYVDANFEPFPFTDLPANKYEIVKLQSILTTAVNISEEAGNLIFRNETSRFLLSPMEEA